MESHDITHLLNTWLTALRTPDLKNFLILGEMGQLEILRDLLFIWGRSPDVT